MRVRQRARRRRSCMPATAETLGIAPRLTTRQARRYLVLYNRTRPSRASCSGSKAHASEALRPRANRDGDGWRQHEKRTQARQDVDAQRSSAPAVSPKGEPKAANSQRRRKADGAGSGDSEIGRRRRGGGPGTGNPCRIRADRQGAYARRARAAHEVLQEHDPADLAVAASAQLPATPRRRVVPDRTRAADAGCALPAQHAHRRHPAAADARARRSDRRKRVDLLAQRGRSRLHPSCRFQACGARPRARGRRAAARARFRRAHPAGFRRRQGRAVRDHPDGVLLCIGRRARLRNRGPFRAVLRQQSGAPGRVDAGRSALADRRDLHRQRARIASARRLLARPTRWGAMPPPSMRRLR